MIRDRSAACHSRPVEAFSAREARGGGTTSEESPRSGASEEFVTSTALRSSPAKRPLSTELCGIARGKRAVGGREPRGPVVGARRARINLLCSDEGRRERPPLDRG